MSMFKILQNLSLKIFFISFLVGLLFLYILGPETKKVYVYPNQETVGKAIFQDKTNQCFSYLEEAVMCPNDKKDISTIPVQ
jgi:hypothetical protein